jgi:hypothetical protein
MSIIEYFCSGEEILIGFGRDLKLEQGISQIRESEQGIGQEFIIPRN